jgi:hypothetical protein
MDGNRGLNRCSEVNRDKFFWVSHTYSHQHLDWAGGCTPEGLNCNPTSPGKVGSEIDKNVELINGDLTGNMFYEDPEGLKYVSSFFFLFAVVALLRLCADAANICLRGMFILRVLCRRLILGVSLLAGRTFRPRVW